MALAPRTSVPFRLVAALAGPLLLVACSAPASPPPAAPSGAVGPAVPGALQGLADLAVQRILLSDKVSSAKFGTAQPIDDPPREQQVLNAVAAAAPGLGVDPGEGALFFRDQIEASKLVQRGLYQSWTQHPEQRPAAKPNLATEVRPALDRLSTELMRQLQASAAVRHAPDQCPAQRAGAAAQAGERLDALHREALGVALRSVCPS